MCSGTPMSGQDPALSVPLRNKGYYFLLSSQRLIAPLPSCPPPHHCSPLFSFCPPLSTCPHIWIAPIRRAPLILYHLPLFILFLLSFFTILSTCHLIIPSHCRGRILFRVNPPPLYSEVTLPNEEEPMSSVLADILLSIGEVQRNKSRLTIRASRLCVL